MIKKKMACLGPFMSLFMLLSFGCSYLEKEETKSGSSGSSSTTEQEQPHGQVTVNLLERTPFRGQDLDPEFWTKMEAYCKAGPTQLIVADMNLVPNQMTRAGFVARWAAQCYALATTYAGYDWAPDARDPQSVALWNARPQMEAWWHRYVLAVIKVMQNAPQTTALIIINDAPDRLGYRLGVATYKTMEPVRGRVTIGNTIQ